VLPLYISGSSLMNVVNLIAALPTSSLGFHVMSDDALPPWLKGRLSSLAPVCANISVQYASHRENRI